jgi:hypothetical protein
MTLVEQAKILHARTLLLGGSKSPAYLKGVLNGLQKALPQATRIELKGVGHLAADNGGKPERVAAELKKFLRGRN